MGTVPRQDEWLDQLKGLKSAHKRGYRFQDYVRTLFAKEHFKVTMNAGGAAPRQTDLMASRAEVTYLVETKWQKEPVDIDDIDSLFTRLGETAASVIGVFVSWSGFTSGAIDRVRQKRVRHMLLVTGSELEKTNSFIRMLRRKQGTLLTDGTVLFEEGIRTHRRSAKTNLPAGSTRFDIGGKNRRWLSCAGRFEQFAFVGELPDIDWVPGMGAGVSADFEVPTHTEKDLFRVLRELTEMNWTSENGRWAIQQAKRNWHGCGAQAFVDVVADWKGRYKDLDTIHHTEEFCYMDVCDGGFYTLVGQLSADGRRIGWRTTMSFQLSGIPVRQDAMRHLCDTFDVEEPLFYRPRTEDLLHRGHAEAGPVLDVVGFVVQEDGLNLDPSDREWSSGLIARNPYREQTGHGFLEWWPDGLEASELIICALRNWHPLSEPRQRYRLWSCEWAWTSDALVVRPLADWDDDTPRNEKPPRSVGQHP